MYNFVRLRGDERVHEREGLLLQRPEQKSSGHRNKNIPVIGILLFRSSEFFRISDENFKLKIPVAGTNKFRSAEQINSGPRNK
mgnify:CR=1 FL=1